MKKFLRTILEINNVSFKYYIVIYAVLVAADIWQEGFISETIFPLKWLVWFILLAALTKLLFNLERISNWFERHPSRLSQGFLRILQALSRLKTEPQKIFFSIFIYSLILYLLESLTKESGAGFVEKYLNINLRWLVGLIIISGVLMALFRSQETKGPNQLKSVGKKFSAKRVILFILAILLALVGGGLVYLETKEFGVISYVLSLLSALSIIMFLVVAIQSNSQAYADKK